MKNVITKIADWYEKLPEKKKHVEFVTAILSVPVMLTVIIINLNNLNQQKSNSQSQKGNGSITPIQVIISGAMGEPKTTTSPNTIQPTNIPTTTPTPASCIKEIGPVSITSPRENEVISKNPVCIVIATEEDYCAIEWSYRLDNGEWSDYSDKYICLYNLSNGTRIIGLKIKSTATDEVVTLQRSFIYQGNTIPTAEPTVASSSAVL